MRARPGKETGSWLDTRVPPVVVLLAGLLLIGTLPRLIPVPVRFASPLRIPLAVLLFAMGVALVIAAWTSFRKVRTTVNPTNPDKTEHLVTDGVYRISRNPMYLAMLLVLCGFVAVQGELHGLLVLPAFIAYMTRYQVVPEERALARKFGDEFARYRARVRRWL